jgi:hypothetical protein
MMIVRILSFMTLLIFVDGCKDNSSNIYPSKNDRSSVILKNVHFIADIPTEGPAIVWIDGCRDPYMFHPNSLNKLETLYDVARRRNESTCMDGKLAGEITSLELYDRPVIRVESISVKHLVNSCPWKSKP